MKKFILKAKHLFTHFENRIEELSDWTAHISASPWFLIIHAIWWTLWIVFKVEPFPYGLLTMILSLEAIVLSALLLSSSNREGDVEKKIARKTLSNSKETNWMVEEIHEIVRDLQEDIQHLMDEEEEEI
jgi:uncharacterized membrane protein